jgi:hypothetical protein
MKLGVCYYPEHWPEAMWAEDAKRMAEIGISQVRIGEFAWTRIEPTPGVFEWGWLDRAIETLHQAGLHIVLGTPTATPPKWLIDAHPDILALDAHGRPRHFGSRRHYCFSSLTYRAQCARIVEALARRYGTHPGIASWQTDNEYGCHDTIISYSNAARAGFRAWLAAKYPSIQALNQAWGNVFWSMEYLSFDEIDPPVETVTEANPAHRQDWARFASDEVSVLRQDLGVPCLTDPNEITEWLKKKSKGLQVVFTTYQSGQALSAAARKAKFHFDLGIMDEAHKTVGDGEKLFSHLLHDRNLPVDRRVFMTATERRYQGRGEKIRLLAIFSGWVGV